jgi:L-ascorbate metabolism protein UlaG (beta-lactamase superfamily)
MTKLRHATVCGAFFLLVILPFPGTAQNSGKSPLEVTYIANEGFLISLGGTKVLIDALQKTKNYTSPSDDVAASMLEGISPFDDVDYVLVTHDHADHFSAEMVSRFLLNHPGTQFIASSEACNKLTGDSAAKRRCSGIDLKMGGHRTIRGKKAEIVALRLEHSGSRDISNLAFLVRSNGYTIMHVGDALLAHNEENLRAIDWSSFGVDLLFVEHFDRSTPAQDIIKNLIKPRHVVLMHIPAGEEEEVRNAPIKAHPLAVVFGKELETKTFERNARKSGN